MKKVLIALMSVALLGGMSSCNKWLDVDADTRVGENIMFESTNGMRIALNGIYLSLGEPTLYGQNLTWGLISALAKDYKDDVTVIAIHSNASKNTSPDFVKKYYSTSNLIFVNDISDKQDDFNGEYYLNLGGSGTYPYTVIIDEFGVIQEIFVKALHYEDLENAVKKIQN